MIDLIVIVVYVAGCIAAGIAFSGRQESTDDYFMADGGMKGWFNSILVGLSIAATLFSGISFLMLPSVYFGGGTVLILGILSFPAAWVVLRFWFLPRYFAGPEGQKPFDILERRFGPTVRTAAAAMYMLLRVGWMAALIYAPTLALMGAWELENRWFWPIVLTIGVSSTFYTVLGGIRGVILTDALQFVVIAVGVVFVIGTIAWRLPIGLGEGMSRVVDEGLFGSFTPSLSLQTMTIWAVLAGALVNNMGNYIGDQMSLQRYLASGDAEESSRAFLVNTIGAVVVIGLLAVVGIFLRMWYLAVPDAGLPLDHDKVFPYFIAKELPVGLTGLVLAAVLAATMSSMTSGINTLAAVITLDFWERFWPESTMTDRQQLRFSRGVSLGIGAASTLAAGFVGAFGSIFDISQTVLGALGGPLFACVLLAATRLRLSPSAVFFGCTLGFAAGVAAAWSPANSLWVGPASFGVSVLMSLVLTQVLPRSTSERGVWRVAPPAAGAVNADS